MNQRNRKRLFVGAGVITVLIAVFLFPKIMNTDTDIDTSITENTEIQSGDSNAEQNGKDVIIQGTRPGGQNIANNDYSNETEDDLDDETNDFEDGPYAYITIADLSKHGKELEGINIYTVGEILKISDQAVYIKTEDKPIIAYIYEEMNAKEGDPIALYGSVIKMENNKEEASAVMRAAIIKAGAGANAYRESGTDERIKNYLE